MIGTLIAGCGGEAEQRELSVIASAYTSTPAQTNDAPFVGAWGDRLDPGQRSVAVSRDLIALGLDRGTRIEVEGLEGELVVKDKMAARWRRHIDIYMGLDHDAARDWGRRRVVIRWTPRDPEGSSSRDR